MISYTKGYFQKPCCSILIDIMSVGGGDLTTTDYYPIVKNVIIIKIKYLRAFRNCELRREYYT